MWDETKIDQIINLNIPTPFYCYDESIFIKRADNLKRRLLRTAKLCYSVKSNPWMIMPALSVVDYVEVCSMGELEICLENGINQSKIIIGGVSKKYTECIQIAKLSPHRISVESVHQLNMLNNAADEVGTSPNVLIRLTSGNQFGISLDDAIEVFSNRDLYSHVNIMGLHYYPGTQKKRVEDADKIINFLLNISKQLSVQEIEFGAGFSVPLYENQSESLYAPYIDRIISGIDKMSPIVNITYECGRYLTYDCGTYVSEITDIKSSATRNYIIADGGINHIHYYGQIGGRPIPNVMAYPFRTNHKVKYTVCGSLCTASDVLANEIYLPAPEIGDKLVFLGVGAYSATEAMGFFLSRDLPSIIILHDSKPRLIRHPIKTYRFNSRKLKEY